MVSLIEEKMGRGRISVVDDELWGLAEQKLQEGISLIHFITDSRDYLHMAWKRFGDSVCYGLLWQQRRPRPPHACNGLVNAALTM